MDRFYIAGNGWSAGPATSPLRLTDAVLGPVTPVPYTVTERRGCDLAPIDAATTEGRLRLTSFVWPHDLHRYERLRAALAVAASIRCRWTPRPPRPGWPSMLAPPAPAGVLTVVWHSITRQYWPAEEIAATSRVLAAARDRMPIAHIAMESPVLVDDRAEGEQEYRPAELTVQLSVPGALADPDAGAAGHGGRPRRSAAAGDVTPRPASGRRVAAVDRDQPARERPGINRPENGRGSAGPGTADRDQPAGTAITSGCSAPCGMSMRSSPVRSARRITPAT